MYFSVVGCSVLCVVRLSRKCFSVLYLYSAFSFHPLLRGVLASLWKLIYPFCFFCRVSLLYIFRGRVIRWTQICDCCLFLLNNPFTIFSISCKSFCLKVYFVLYINIGKSALVVFNVFAPMLVHQSALFLSVLQNLVKTFCLLVMHSHLILFIVILVFFPIYYPLKIIWNENVTVVYILNRKAFSLIF